MVLMECKVCGFLVKGRLLLVLSEAEKRESVGL